MTFRSLVVAMWAFSLVACASAPDMDDPAGAESDQGDDADEGTGDVPAVDAGAKDAGKSTGSSSSAASSKDAGNKTTSTGSASSTSSSSTSTTKDAGSSASSSSSTSSTVKSDAGAAANPLDALTGLLGGATGSSDGGKPATSSSGDGGVDHCGPDLFCFDIFDCAIFHPDALDCGFTKCEGFVCKK